MVIRPAGSMQVRPPSSPEEVRQLSTDQLRERFLVEGLTAGPTVELTYSHHDRIVVGGVRPGPEPVPLPTPAALRSATFLERRELGVLNVGTAPGTVTVDGARHPLDPLDGLYVGRGAEEVTFSAEPGPGLGAGAGGRAAAFYLVSTQAHATYPTTRVTLKEADPVRLGSVEGSNERTIHKYVHADGVRSCELVLGVTVLGPGSMWNTMPCHTHDRRTEVYFYFGLPAGERVVHLMGEPDQTRHLLVADQQAVISPPWSVHCGFGTRSYAFVWAMGGENQAYTDVEVVDLERMR